MDQARPPEITIMIASDVDYDHLISEIYVDGEFLALVTGDPAGDELIVDFPPRNGPIRSMPLALVHEAFDLAKRRLVGG